MDGRRVSASATSRPGPDIAAVPRDRIEFLRCCTDILRQFFSANRILSREALVTSAPRPIAPSAATPLAAGAKHISIMEETADASPQ